MKRKTLFVLVVCLSLVAFLASMSLAAPKKDIGPPPNANIPDWAPPYDGGGLITVLNPEGIRPEVQCYPLTERVADLEGKTIYVVDVKYPSTTNFANELMSLLEEKYPGVHWEYRQKKGTYFENDPDLWDEIKTNAAGMIIFVGH